MHGSTSSTAGTGILHEQFCHDFSSINSRGNRVCVLTVVRELLVSLLDGVVDKTRDGLLPVVKMHETTDLSLHVLLVASVFETTGQLHGLVQLHKSILVGFQGAVVFGNLFRRVSKTFLQLRTDAIPWQVNWRSHHCRFCVSSGGGFGINCGSHGQWHMLRRGASHNVSGIQGGASKGGSCCQAECKCSSRELHISTFLEWIVMRREALVESTELS
mmetsp:Transcript_35150/g.85137  ORF Transcript_35150/g.85137 Transcript_35150/m.85137 type:complete len:216 (-) Transcript_35150:46-693(-)